MDFCKVLQGSLDDYMKNTVEIREEYMLKYSENDVRMMI